MVPISNENRKHVQGTPPAVMELRPSVKMTGWEAFKL